MRAVVIGSSGFIGRWVSKHLTGEGHEVVGLDKAEPPEGCEYFRTHRCDILDSRRLRSIIGNVSPDAIIHLAARTDLDERNDLGGYAANVEGVRNILEAVYDAPSIQRVIVTSSQLVCRVGYVPKTMEEYCPNTLYGESKVLTEKIVKQTDCRGKEWCIVRPTTVWGPYMSEHYQRLLKLIRRGLYFHCGKGKLLKSYSYVENIAYQYGELLVASADLVNHKTYYLADYDPLSLRDYADRLALEMKAPKIHTMPLVLAKVLSHVGDGLSRKGPTSFPFNSYRLRNILTEYQFDLSATKKVCGALPITFEAGVKTTAGWFMQMAK